MSTPLRGVETMARTRACSGIWGIATHPAKHRRRHVYDDTIGEFGFWAVVAGKRQPTCYYADSITISKVS